MKEFDFSEFPPLSKDSWVEMNLSALGEDEFLDMYHRKFISGIDVNSYYTLSDTAAIEHVSGKQSATGWNYHERINFSSMEDLYKIKNTGVHGVILSEMGNINLLALKELQDLKISFDHARADEAIRLRDTPYLTGFLFDSEILLDLINSGFKSRAIDIRSVNGQNDVLYEIVVALLQLNEMIEAETDFTQFFDRLYVRASVSTNYYQEILKLRTLHSLLSAVLDQYGIEDAVIPIFAELGGSLEGMDLDQQLIRLTSVMMSAILGGVTDMEVCLDTEDHAKTLYRNVSNLLREEAYLSRVADPLKGSYFFEKAGMELSIAAWSRFQLIARRGGLAWLSSDYSRYQNLFA